MNSSDGEKIRHVALPIGQDTVLMDNAPWGSYFGMLTDRYGIQCMIHRDQQ